MERGLVSAEATFQRLSRRPQERRARWQRRGAEGGRPAELLTPGAVARFSFEPPRALGPSLPWYSSLEESPGSSEAERCDRLRGRSDQPASDLAYPPKRGGASNFPAASRDIPHSALCNCKAPKSGSPTHMPQGTAPFAFIRSWCALTRAVARSMTTPSPLPKYGLPVSQITAPTGVRPRCYTVCQGVVGFAGPDRAGSSRMPAAAVSAGSSSLPAHGQLRMGVREGRAIEAPA
jgi:hypothetical protein